MNKDWRPRKAQKKLKLFFQFIPEVKPNVELLFPEKLSMFIWEPVVFAYKAFPVTSRGWKVPEDCTAFVCPCFGCLWALYVVHIGIITGCS